MFTADEIDGASVPHDEQMPTAYCIIEPPSTLFALYFSNDV